MLGGQQFYNTTVTIRKVLFDGMSTGNCWYDDESLCFPFSVLHCVEMAFHAASRGAPKSKHGASRDEFKSGRGRGWHARRGVLWLGELWSSQELLGDCKGDSGRDLEIL